MAIEGLFHFNINVRDLNRSIAFYETLGFQLQSQQDFVAPPGTETGMRIPAGHGRQAVMRIGSDPANPVLDMIEWQDAANAPAPYAGLTNIGIARIAFRTTGLRATYAQLKRAGVEFWSEPQEFPAGPGKVVYVIFADPDGTLLELIEFEA